MESPSCQIYCVTPMASDEILDVPKSFGAKAKVRLARQLGPSGTRRLKRHLSQIHRLISRLSRRSTPRVSSVTTDAASLPLQAGDRVRVKTWEEISTTLGLFNDLNGLVFMPEMAQYCDTQQRVLKPLTRFVDERELRVRKARGIVLLEGLMCDGTEMFGPCDRSCFFFWREEWLDKIE